MSCRRLSVISRIAFLLGALPILAACTSTPLLTPAPTTSPMPSPTATLPPNTITATPTATQVLSTKTPEPTATATATPELQLRPTPKTVFVITDGALAELTAERTVKPVVDRQGKYYTVGPMIYVKTDAATGFVLQRNLGGLPKLTSQNSREATVDDPEIKALGLPPLPLTKDTKANIELRRENLPWAYGNNHPDMLKAGNIMAQGGDLIGMDLDEEEQLVLIIQGQTKDDIRKVRLPVINENHWLEITSFYVGPTPNYQLPNYGFQTLARITDAYHALLFSAIYANQYPYRLVLIQENDIRGLHYGLTFYR